jgi:hypothetical protein
MNERIKELYKNVLASSENMRWNIEDAEKFAELIVRECALTAGLMEHEGRKGIGAQILDNFGVEL